MRDEVGKVNLIPWWSKKPCGPLKPGEKPCCASCGSCKTCGKSLQNGGYEWNGKRFCSEACTRAGGYRDNPMSVRPNPLLIPTEDPNFRRSTTGRWHAVRLSKKSAWYVYENNHEILSALTLNEAETRIAQHKRGVHTKCSHAQ